MIEAVRGDYQRAKRLRGVLDYDDLIVETRNLLRDGGAAQWVLYKLDGGIDHVLIDEAQDTSPEQWDIVKTLTEDFFAGAGPRRGAWRAPSSRWATRNSPSSASRAPIPRQFDRQPPLFRRAGRRPPAQNFRDQPLITSRRSAPDVLPFVDKVFASDAARAGLTFGGSAITPCSASATPPRAASSSGRR